MNGIQQGNENIISTLVKFKELQERYNKNRTRSFIEDWSIGKNSTIAKEHPEISLKRSDLINIRTFCAHGTKAWALFSACAFANGQLLPGNEIKVTGMFAASGESKGQDDRSKNFVSAMPLFTFRGDLTYPIRFAFDKTEWVVQNDNYEQVKEKFLKKYNKRSNSGSIKKEIQNLFNNVDMQKAYEKLSNIAAIIIGDAIGVAISNFCFSTGPSPIWGETVCKRVNVRVVAVDGENNKVFIQKLIQSIAPELAKTIAFFTIEEIKEFQKKREKFDEDHYLKPFVCDFIDTLSEKLPFHDSFVNEIKEITNKEVCLIKSRRCTSTVLCSKTKTRAVMTGYYDQLHDSYFECNTMQSIPSANPDLAKITVLLTPKEVSMMLVHYRY